MNTDKTMIPVVVDGELKHNGQRSNGGGKWRNVTTTLKTYLELLQVVEEIGRKVNIMRNPLSSEQDRLKTTVTADEE